MDIKYYELTNPQKSILLTDQMYRNTPIANVCGTVIIEENVNFNALEKAMNLFVRENDSFRLKFVEKETMMQYVADYVPFTVDNQKVGSDEEVKKLEKKIVSAPFNVTKEPVYKLQMFEFPNWKGGFIVCAHHFIADAWTSGIIVDEIMANYANIINNNILDREKFSYTDYILSEKKYLESGRFQKDAEYWNNLFNEVPEIASIPSNSVDYSLPDYVAKREKIIIDKEIIDKVNEICYENKVSIFNFFMAVYAIYIGRVSNLREFVIGTPILNRSTFKEKNTAGMFISTVPFKINIEDEFTFQEFIIKIANDTLGMLRHQKYPYDMLLQQLRKNNSTLPNLYNILISYQNVRTNKQTFEIPYHTRWVFNETTSDGLDISFCDMDDSGNIDVCYDYSISKYTKTDIQKIHNRIIHIVNQIINNPQKKLKEFEIITPEEKNKILEARNKNYKETTIVELFEEQVKRTPNQIAVIHNEEKITYKELENMVNVVANKLKNVKGEKVAVIANKSTKLIATLLGIMKSGNAYVPIDPNYPKERVEYILKDCGANFVLASKQFYNGKNVIYIEDIDFSCICNFDLCVVPEQLAYMIYTSGTTGNPKGVQIKHKNIVNTLQWRKEYYNFNEEIITLQVPSYSFDSSVEDIFTSLISGSTLVIPSATKLDINVVENDIKKNNVNHFLVVPSLYKVILEEKAYILKSFKFITIAGENFGINLVKEHFEKLPNVRLINEYGPTENSVCSTYYELTKDDEKVLIGKPISNCRAYVLDENLNLLPEGACGELYVAGKGVSIGYLNKPEMTHKSFIKSPFADEILYKTGDIVKYYNDNLEFVGRNDGQVKLNGFRIELKEIDNAILKHPNVKDSITVMQKLKNGRDILCSYIIIKNECDINEHLKENLPYYMIPEIIIVDEYPLTPNGKIDKKKLPIPDVKLKMEKPTTKMEKEILDVCKEVLNNNNLGVTDDIFKLGMADSLSILTITSKLFAKNIKIDTQDFYKYTTVKELANKNIVKEEYKNIIKPKYKMEISEFVDNKQEFCHKNVLLTGVTGYLGIHLLYELLVKTNANVFCIIRSKNNKNAEERIKETIEYYFDAELYNKYVNRIKVFEGELTHDNLGLSCEKYNELLNVIDCIIHSAAITKHYGQENIFINENIVSTQNLIKFAMIKKILLNYISTTTVSGNYLVKTKINKEFSENDFFVGQDYENNPYVKSKFEAERIIFEEQYNGLNANIFRLGNLMGRKRDGKFQKNKMENAFYLRLLTFASVGLLPKNLENENEEFSPIDDVASAICKLISLDKSINKTFHIFNPNKISTIQLVKVLNKYGINCEVIENKEFIEELKKKPQFLKYLVSDLDFSEDMLYKTGIRVVNDITEKVLEIANFKWTVIDEKYISNFLEATNFLEDVKAWRDKL